MSRKQMRSTESKIINTIVLNVFNDECKIITFLSRYDRYIITTGNFIYRNTIMLNFFDNYFF